MTTKTTDQMEIVAKKAFLSETGENIKCPVCEDMFRKNRYHHIFCSRNCKVEYHRLGAKTVSPVIKTSVGIGIKKLREAANRIANDYVDVMDVKDYDFCVDVAESHTSASKLVDSPRLMNRFFDITEKLGVEL